MLTNQNEPSSDTLSDILKYGEAILSGALDTLEDTANLLAHPIDNVLIPMSILVYDAAIVIARYKVQEPGLEMFAELFEKNPEIYAESMGRFEQLVASIKKAGVDFSDADGLERTRMATHVVTSVLLPAAYFKGCKVISRMVRNHHTFGLLSEPPLFVSALPERQLAAQSFKFNALTLEEIRKTVGIKNYIYVITEDKEILMALRHFEGPEFVNGTFRDYLIHTDLAGLKRVYAAGEVYTEHGVIKQINNCSGHFMPEGEHLARVVESAFLNYGFAEAHGAYSELKLFANAKPIITRGIIYPLQPSSMYSSAIVGSSSGLVDLLQQSGKTTDLGGFELSFSSSLEEDDDEIHMEETPNGLETAAKWVFDKLDGMISLNTAQASVPETLDMLNEQPEASSGTTVTTIQSYRPSTDYSEILSGIRSMIQGVDDNRLVTHAMSFFTQMDEYEQLMGQQVKDFLEQHTHGLNLSYRQEKQYQYLLSQVLAETYFEKTELTEEVASVSFARKEPPTRINRINVSRQLHQASSQAQAELARHIQQVNQAISATPQLIPIATSSETESTAIYEPTFNDYAQTVDQAGQLAAHFAHFIGHDREAQVIGTLTSSAVTIGIASAALIAGTIYTPLGWLMIANGVLGGIRGLTQGSDHSVEQMMQAVQSLASLINTLHQRFDHIDRMLDRQYLEMMAGFSALRLSNTLNLAKLNFIYAKINKVQEENTAAYSALTQKIDHLSAVLMAHHRSAKESELKIQVLKVLNKASDLWNENAYDDAWVGLIAALDQDVTLPLLTGSEVNTHNARAVIAHLRDYAYPTAVGYDINLIANHINTLGRFYVPNQLRQRYHKGLVHQLLKTYLQKEVGQQGTELIIEGTEDPTGLSLELLLQLKTALTRIDTPVLLPLVNRDGWTLIYGLNHDNASLIYYFNPQGGMIPEALLRFCQHELSEVVLTNFSYLMNVNQDDTACLVVHAAQLLLKQNNIETFLNTFKQLKEKGSAGINALKIGQTELMQTTAEALPCDLPNPLMWSYLTTTLLYLMNVYHGGPSGAAVGHGIKRTYLEQLGEVIQVGERMTNMIYSLRNPAIYTQLTHRYHTAFASFKQAFAAEIELFNAQYDTKLNDDYDAKAVNQIDWLRKNADFMENKIKAFVEAPHYWYRTYGFSQGDKSDHLNNRLNGAGDGRTVSGANTYQVTRVTEIRNAMALLVKNRENNQSTIDKCRHHILGHPVHAEWVEINPNKIFRVLLPADRDDLSQLGKPSYAGDVLALPMPDDFLDSIPVEPIWYQAEALGLGQLNYLYSYKNHGDKPRFIISVHFISDERSTLPPVLVEQHEYDFVVAEPYQKVVGKENAEAVLAFWMDNSLTPTGAMSRTPCGGNGRWGTKSNYQTREEQELPNFKFQEGHRNKLKTLNPKSLLNEVNPHYAEQKQMMVAGVADHFQCERRKFYDDYLIKRLSEDSPIGNAYAELKAAYHLLFESLHLAANSSHDASIIAHNTLKQQLISAEQILHHLQTESALLQLTIPDLDMQLFIDVFAELGSDSLYPYLVETLQKANEYYHAYQHAAVDEVIHGDNPELEAARAENARLKIASYEMLKRAEREQWPAKVIDGLRESLITADEMVSAHQNGVRVVDATASVRPRLTTSVMASLPRIRFHSPISANTANHDIVMPSTNPANAMNSSNE